MQVELARTTEAGRQTSPGFALRLSQYCLPDGCRGGLLPAGVEWVEDSVNTSGVWLAVASKKPCEWAAPNSIPDSRTSTATASMSKKVLRGT